MDKEISDFQEAFSTTIIHQSQDTLGTLNHQLAQNGFDFSLNLPKLRNISLELSAQDMIGEALSKRVGTETRLREQSNWKGGGAKRWLGNIFDQYDWGYEDVTVAVNHYVVSLPDIKARATQKLKSGLKQLESGFTSQIEEPMTTAIDDFFLEFKSRVEHIRSDLLQSLREKQKSEEDQHKLIDSLKKHRKKADKCKVDSKNLGITLSNKMPNRIEALRSQMNNSEVPAELLTALPSLSEKFVIDFANSLDVVDDHLSVNATRSGFFERMRDSFTGQRQRRDLETHRALASGARFRAAMVN